MILITGAFGFVGSYLVDELDNLNYQLVLLDKENMYPFFSKSNHRLHMTDITNPINLERLSNYKISSVVHLASMQPVNVRKEDETKYVDINIKGTLNVLNYCKDNRIKKVIYIASSKNIQSNWSNKKLDESTEKSIKFGTQFSFFSLTESFIIDMFEHYSRKFDMDCIVIRVPPIYGYGPHLEGFYNGKSRKTGFWTFIENAIEGKPLRLFGDVSRKREMIYVKDVVSAIIKFLRTRKNLHGVYNISSEKPISLFEEAAEIIEVFSNSEFHSGLLFDPQTPNLVEEFFLDTTKIKNDLGWKSSYDLHDMLVDTKKEMESKKFEYLVKKRKRMLEEL